MQNMNGKIKKKVYKESIIYPLALNIQSYLNKLESYFKEFT